MGWRAARERNGFVKVYYRDGSARVLRPNEYEPLTAAVRRGDDWYEGEDLYGDPSTIRVSAIVEVMFCSPTGVAAYDADEDDRKAHQTATGED